MKYSHCRVYVRHVLFILLLSLPLFNSANAMDINTASAEELQTLKGIGPKRAAAIIRYREENGEIQSPEDLIKVPGVGSSIVKANSNELTFSKIGAPPPSEE
ncbi:ComE operon protein 1 [Zhongshania aliphaticivorans]|uniref:ComE operon protein 1 n=1 Tax=Zhongshania aliphaticivorans TaxID=1470434 RepID=A0A5S9N497_9GAMM|nr:ComEA family DNA-binding protein [Zhongshania aliphaticivorans]CAA0082403.1 ComE operon protein 1 [Zhongshania aliphaticivorans]CAA0084332.1 ComE operon protein 1 [Zhongshania aliphaticivorans]